MEFSSRNTQRVSNRPVATPAPVTAPKQPQASHAPKSNNTKIFKVLGIVLFFSLLILSVAAIISISLRENETSFVDKNQYQVVTLVDKQAYFGKINKISKDYIVISDIFYIQGTESQAEGQTTNGTTLVKRGCLEIHKPQDQMVVYRDQVDFWENLQSDSKVSQAISQFKKDNPDKSKECDKLIQQQEAAASQQASDDTKDAKDPATDTTGPTAADSTTKKSTTNTSN